jgi:hypothetical protein
VAFIFITFRKAFKEGFPLKESKRLCDLAESHYIKFPLSFIPLKYTTLGFPNEKAKGLSTFSA